jgi:hypothetical protein
VKGLGHVIERLEDIRDWVTSWAESARRSAEEAKRNAEDAGTAADEIWKLYEESNSTELAEIHTKAKEAADAAKESAEQSEKTAQELENELADIEDELSETREKKKRLEDEQRGRGMEQSWEGGPGGCQYFFVATGKTYGHLGDLVITNVSDMTVSGRVDNGSCLVSSDDVIQDLRVLTLPCEAPPDVYKLGTEFKIQPGKTKRLALTGTCDDFGKPAPAKGVKDLYTLKGPDKEGKIIVNAVKRGVKFDPGKLKLKVFSPDQAHPMILQSLVWFVESRCDDTDGNEVTLEQLEEFYVNKWEKDETARKALAKMNPDQRLQADQMVKEDMKKIVASINFLKEGNMEL